MAGPLSLAEHWPEIIPELEDALRSDGHVELALTVASLSAFGVCTCGHCQSFYTSNTAGPWPSKGQHCNLDYLDRDIVFDVLDNAIVYVELLRDPNHRWRALAEHFSASPRPPQPEATD